MITYNCKKCKGSGVLIVPVHGPEFVEGKWSPSSLQEVLCNECGGDGHYHFEEKEHYGRN